MKEPRNIEELFKESFNGFEVDPGNNAWANIQSQISTPVASTASTSNSGIWAASGSKALTAIIAASIIGLSIGGYLYFDSQGSKQKKQRLLQEEVAQPKVNTIEENKIPTKEQTPIKNITEVEHAIVLEKKPQAEETVKNSNQVEKQIEKTSNIELDQNNKVIDATDVEINNSENTKISITEDTQSSDIDERISSKNEVIPTENNIISESNDPVIVANNNAPTKKSEPAKKSGSEGVSEPIFNIDNIFSPNGDNVNDVFEIKVEGADQIEVQIFNKAGKKIHYWIGEYGFWDGRNMDDSPAPPDTYVYIVSVKKSGKTFPKKGMINLVR